MGDQDNHDGSNSGGKMGDQDNDNESTSGGGGTLDEEARLKDKLVSKKKEVDLKNKLIAKKERRTSEGSKDNDSPKGHGGGSSSRERYVVPARRSSGPDRFHRGGGPYSGGLPRGGGRGGWGGSPGPRDRYYEMDRYGGGPPPGPYRGGFMGGRGGYHGGPPHRGPPNHFHDQDPFGRAPPPRRYPRSRSRSRSISGRSRSYSRSFSRSYSRSRSRSLSRSPLSDEDGRRSKRGRSQDRGRSRRRKHRRRSSRGRRQSRSPSTSGSSISSSSSSSSSSDESEASKNENGKTKGPEDGFSKDQRTIFVSQLVMRTTAKEVRHYFRRKVGAKVKDVSFLEDKRTGKHKGCAYVELKTMEDVGKALGASGQPPDFQRFPILVKPSEAEKNYLIPASSVTVTSNMMGGSSSKRKAPLIGPNGQPIEAQRVYVGNLDQVITQEHLFKLFSQFGELYKVQLQMEPTSGLSKGFAFLSFRDPKDGNLAIQTMSNQTLGGKAMKTGWASQMAATPGVQVVTTEEFPKDASAKAQRAHIALAQLTIGAGASVVAPDPAGTAASAAVTAAARPAATGLIPTVAEARHGLAASAASGIMGVPTIITTPTAVSLAPPDAKVIGRGEKPSNHLLIRNMFDKDEETEPGWADDIKEEFKEECQKFGKIENVLVMSKDPGGKIYASFDTNEAAKTCASSLAGRWFDKRQLRVEFVDEGDIPKEA